MSDKSILIEVPGTLEHHPQKVRVPHVSDVENPCVGDMAWRESDVESVDGVEAVAWTGENWIVLTDEPEPN